MHAKNACKYYGFQHRLTKQFQSSIKPNQKLPTSAATTTTKTLGHPDQTSFLFPRWTSIINSWFTVIKKPQTVAATVKLWTMTISKYFCGFETWTIIINGLGIWRHSSTLMIEWLKMISTKFHELALYSFNTISC